MPATIRPAPTMAESAMNQGETSTASTMPSSTSDPAAICTWRMIGSGAFRSAITGRPALFQPWIPPSSW